MATATASRSIRRTICEKHGIEFGQELIPHSQEHESVWVPVMCRNCEEELRNKLRADEELAAQVAEITAEAERRIAADPDHAKKIQEFAAKDLTEE